MVDVVGNMLGKDGVVSEQEFARYVRVQASGRTNMFMLSNVQSLSGLSKEKIMYIMKHYGELDKKYPSVREKLL